MDDQFALVADILGIAEARKASRRAVGELDHVSRSPLAAARSRPSNSGSDPEGAGRIQNFSAVEANGKVWIRDGVMLVNSKRTPLARALPLKPPR